MMKGKGVKSIYMDEETATRIEQEAQRQKRKFSYIANEILKEWVKKHPYKEKA